MRTTTFLLLAFAGAVQATSGALAASPATQDQADTLRALFQRYLGTPAAGEPSNVTIVPEGVSYRASLDLKAIGHPFESFGVTLDPATQTILLTPSDDGTWHVASDAMPPVVMHLKQQTITFKTSSYKFEGTFDPKLGVFIDQTTVQDGSTMDQDSPAVLQQRRTGHSVLTESATSGAQSSANVTLHYATSDVTAHMTMQTPPQASVEVAPSTPPVEFSYAMPTSALDAHIDRLPALRLLDLWSFFVAHPNRDAVMASQDELRGLLRAALPLMGGLTEGASAESLVVTTSLGEFSARTFASSLALADLSGAGTVTAALAIDGLVAPSLDLPPWSVGFVPTMIELKPTIIGLHVDEAAKAAVDDFDLKSDGFTSEQRDRIVETLWPGDGRVVLAPSRLASGLLDLRLEGEARIGAQLSGHLSVVATGLDKAIATVQAAAGLDPTAAQVLTGLVTAKNLAKPNDAGGLTWLIEATGNNSVTVNGVPLQ